MKKILSIDGGGIRGIIPGIILSEIENRTGIKTAKAFDLIAGTSIGGILALGLVKNNGNGNPQYKASDLAELYEKRGKEIFSRSLWKGITSVGSFVDEKYPHDNIEKILKEYFGDEPIGTALTDVLISSYDIHIREPYFFKSWREEWKSVEMRFVARATSAAPTYFEPAFIPVGGSMRALIDGGVFINNPAMSAFVEEKKKYPDDEVIVISLGTGELVRPIQYSEAKDWGKAGWMLPLLSCMFDGASDAVNYQLKHLLGEKYIRLQTTLSVASDDMDDATTGNIENLKYEADKLIKTNREQIDKIIQLITK